ncbi:MAG: hypothetical protein AAF821_26530 [Cyanobacteria bacterium P01_D01_bin.156]
MSEIDAKSINPRRHNQHVSSVDTPQLAPGFEPGADLSPITNPVWTLVP